MWNKNNQKDMEDLSNSSNIISKGSNLTGNLKAAILIIEEGAKFDGMSSMLKAQSIDSKVKKINTSNS